LQSKTLPSGFSILSCNGSLGCVPVPLSSMASPAAYEVAFAVSVLTSASACSTGAVAAARAARAAARAIHALANAVAWAVLVIIGGV